jgi:hypothetical protein
MKCKWFLEIVTDFIYIYVFVFVYGICMYVCVYLYKSIFTYLTIYKWNILVLSVHYIHSCPSFHYHHKCSKDPCYIDVYLTVTCNGQLNAPVWHFSVEACISYFYNNGDQITYRNKLKEELYILVHNFKRFSPWLLGLMLE